MMGLRIAFLRHGPTAWNQAGLIQGRCDIPLLAEAELNLRTYSLPDEWRAASCITSPLMRARQTAAALGLSFNTDNRVQEMDWGVYEGQTLTQLRAQPRFAEEETLGLDFHPPGGESPRMVAARLLDFLQDQAQVLHKSHLVCISHKGVLRAALSIATGWDMRGKPPVKFDWSSLQIFHFQESCLQLGQINQALVRAR